MTASAMLAHQGGWDEFGIPLLVVFLFFLGAFRRRRRQGAEHTAASSAAEPVCAFCGSPIGEAVERCEACGFRVRGRLGPQGGTGGTDEG
jgi:hypothetical protein